MGAKSRPLLGAEAKAKAPVVADEHARVLVEFLKGARSGAVERLIAERAGGVEVTVVQPPVQRRGYVEQTETTYRVKGSGARKPEARRARGA